MEASAVVCAAGVVRAGCVAGVSVKVAMVRFGLLLVHCGDTVKLYSAFNAGGLVALLGFFGRSRREVAAMLAAYGKGDDAQGIGGDARACR